MSELIKQIKWWETNTQEHHIRGSFNRKLFRDVCNAKNTTKIKRAGRERN